VVMELVRVAVVFGFVSFCVFCVQGYGVSSKSSFSGSGVGSEVLVGCGGARTRMTVTSAPKNRAAVKASKSDESETVRVGVLGASGYTGSEVLELHF
jgi:hypothetical protein